MPNRCTSTSGKLRYEKSLYEVDAWPFLTVFFAATDELCRPRSKYQEAELKARIRNYWAFRQFLQHGCQVTYGQWYDLILT